MDIINSLSNRDTGIAILILVIVALLIFWIVREVLCWYWKVNQTLEVLDKTQKKTEAQLNVVIRLLGKMAGEVVMPVEEDEDDEA